MDPTRKSAVATAAALIITLAAAPAALAHADSLVAFDPEAGQLSEGVAVADDGTVYASLSPLGQLVRVADGGFEVIGTVEGLGEGDFGLIGITVAPDGHVVGGVHSNDPDVNGVWHFDTASGALERIDGSGEIAMANDVAFGDDGTMYVTDTMAGAVWSMPPDGELGPWLVDPIVGGTGEAGFGFPLGANGIDVHDGNVYVGVTETAQVVVIPINEDGSAGEASTLAQYPAPIDGVQVAADGTVYATHPIDNLVTTMAPGGEIEVILMVDDGLDAPSSVDLLTDADGNTVAYIANFSIAMGGPLGAGPGILTFD